MDEVDFTILAATSVFTDLIEKCPPAEACRDAFDRTAKATIKMANSTGGFGQVLPPTQGHKRRGSRGSLDDRLNWSSRSDAAAATSSSNRGSNTRHHHQQRISMDYSSSSQRQYDLPPSDTYSTSADSSTQLPQQKPKRFRISTNLSNPEDPFPSLVRQPHNTTSSSALSADPTAIDPALIPSPSQQTPPTNNPTALSTALNTGGNPFFNPSSSQQLSPIPYSNLQGIEFLHSPNGGGGNGLDPDFGSGNQGDTQMDLNFGLGWESLHHDFSDGQQLDLFDGFFFGDQRGGGGSGMAMSMALDQGQDGIPLETVYKNEQ
jgi:hypothetical protein